MFIVLLGSSVLKIYIKYILSSAYNSGDMDNYKKGNYKNKVVAIHKGDHTIKIKWSSKCSQKIFYCARNFCRA